MAASLSIPGAALTQVRLAASALSRFGRIEGTLVDISGGGAGLVVGEYVPRWSPVTLAVHRTSESEASLISAPAVVRRVRMLDRRPSYLIGVGFEDLSGSVLTELEALLAEIDGVATGEGPA